jgi:hypothetical protein
MIPAPDDVNPTRRLQRLVDGGSHGPLVAELTKGYLRLRPPGAKRDGPAEVSVRWGLLYQRLIAGGR